MSNSYGKWWIGNIILLHNATFHTDEQAVIKQCLSNVNIQIRTLKMHIVEISKPDYLKFTTKQDSMKSLKHKIRYVNFNLKIGSRKNPEVPFAI